MIHNNILSLPKLFENQCDSWYLLNHITFYLLVSDEFGLYDKKSGNEKI